VVVVVCAAAAVAASAKATAAESDLDADSRRLLYWIGSEPLDRIDRLVGDLNRSRSELRPGTLLTREWDEQLQRVMVLVSGPASAHRLGRRHGPARI
jgi:hypothetical protein